MVEQRFDTLGLRRSSDIERDNRRPRSIGSRWARCFSPCKENETNSGECTSRASGMAVGADKKRMLKKMAETQNYESSISDDEEKSVYLTAAESPDDLQWTDRSDDHDAVVESNSRVGSTSRPNVPDCYEISDTSERESENTTDLGISDNEDKKDELAKKWSVVVEGGRHGKNRPSLNAMHRVNADLDRYEKGAGVINYKITVRKITNTDSYGQFSSDLKLPRRSLPATSTPRKSSTRSSSWKPSTGKRASYRETLIRESSLSPRSSVRREGLSNSVRFSNKVENINFSPSRGRPPSLLHSNARKKLQPLSPRPGRRGFSSPPPRRSRSSGSYQEPLRNARSDSSFRRVTFANDSMGSYKASLMRRQEYVDANTSGQYGTESPSRRSVLRVSNGRGRSQSLNRSYSERQYEEDAESKTTSSGKSWNLKNFNNHREFMAQDVNPSESFTEQMRRVQLEGQTAENPFSVWDPDSSRWSRDFEKSFDEFMGPNASGFEKNDDTSSGSLFTDEMEANPRRRLTPREKKLLFHTWNPIFYCNESPGYVRNENIAKRTMIDPRYRVFY